MKHILLLFFISPLLSFSQGFGEHIKQNAIPIDTITILSEAVSDSLTHFELIMVGEYHGTQEPAAFVKSLANLIAQKEGVVSVGLEIPIIQLSGFIENPTKENLLKTKFFSKENMDGRNGQAWFDLVLYCANNERINLFAFDNIPINSSHKRDSIMYVGIKNQKLKFPNSKIITLSGNVHNMQTPYNNVSSMAMYCLQDSNTFSTDKICAINHVFSEGTMLNNIGNGLELRTLTFTESIFTTSVNFPNYLILYNILNSSYNGILYTRKVHHSNVINKE